MRRPDRSPPALELSSAMPFYECRQEFVRGHLRVASVKNLVPIRAGDCAAAGGIPEEVTEDNQGHVANVDPIPVIEDVVIDAFCVEKLRDEEVNRLGTLCHERINLRLKMRVEVTVLDSTL